MMTRFIRHSLLVGAVALLGCSKDLVVPERTETTITESGGVALSAAGETTLRVPAGALPAGTKVVITTDRAPRTGLVGPVFDLATVPKVETFAAPIAIEIQNPTRATRVHVVNVDGATPIAVAGSSYDAATGIARAELAHFSSYGLEPTGSDCGALNPSPGGACSDDGLRCEIGQECCCGQCYPSMVCQCGEGSWGCYATDACLGASLSCPDGGQSPIDSGTSTSTSCPRFEEVFDATCDSPSLICEYGEESCCGETYPSTHCMCVDGRFACRPTDACLRPCPDAGVSEPDAGCDRGVDWITPEECTARGGTRVDDPGDGRTHRCDYRCPSGAAPIANVSFGIEGGACCP